MSAWREHYVDLAPEEETGGEGVAAAPDVSYWRIVWWRFSRHRLAAAAAFLLAALYLAAAFAEFLAPYALETRHIGHIHAPPQSVRLFHEGRLVGPFVYASEQTLDVERLRRSYREDSSRVEKIRFFCRGDAYRFWGLIEGDRHLFCPAEGGALFLMGADRLGRDMFSRILYGARISLTIGLIGVSISFALGLLIGGLSGYFGGIVDALAQRAIEIVRSFPELPLWMALSAALPATLSPIAVYFGLTVILGLLDWVGLARAVRSKLLALREEDFARAAEVIGAPPRRIILRHLLPNFMSHLIAAATLSIPTMILGETALSFLGLGLRAPVTSWGVLLTEAENMSVVALYPWLILPVVPVILTVLAFNFLGDGLRDAADPHH